MIGVVIPAFNEARSIESVVCQIKSCDVAIVVDDGSTDRTAELARSAGAFVVSHEKNLGYDCALETGLCSARDLNCKYAVTMDADGQHDPMLLEIYRQELESGAELVVGQRDRTQRWSEMLFGTITSMIWGLKDPLCGMKGYRIDLLMHLENLNTYQSIGTELAMRLVKGKALIAQPKIKTRSRTGLSRFGSGLKANIRIIKAMMRGLIVAPVLKANG
jgi:glycosyltransferase involved in cell wall biosynthesis